MDNITGKVQIAELWSRHNI